MSESILFKEISSLSTELNNPNTSEIDISTTEEILKMINNEDKLVAFAVEKEIPNISSAVDKLVESLKSGGRLFYFGAGTSGRLGIVDASECPPTFGTDPAMVQGIIAGGDAAVFKAQEGAEDLPENGATKFIELGIKSPDIVCGIAASGRTPFVKGALNQARESGVTTFLITTANKQKAIELGMIADVMICPEVGPEVIAGSTRMKSGTAQKLVLNMLTTAAMIKLGKTFGNIMVDLQLTNLKLKERAKKILMEIGDVDYKTAENYLDKSSGNVKTALVMILTGLSLEDSQKKLVDSDGFIKRAISTT